MVRVASWAVWLLGAGAVLGACGPAPAPPPPSTITVTFAPLPVGVAYLALDSATLELSHIEVIGDRPPQNPPPNTLTLDALSTGGSAVVFPDIAPGVYSRVQLLVETVTAAGTWRGTPFHAHLEMFGGGLVDLRSATGEDIASGRDGAFTVSVDAGSWFASDVLDAATASGGQIVCDQNNNSSVVGVLTMRVVPSFALP